MDRIKKLLPYLVVNIICFYLLMMLVKGMGSGMFILLFAVLIITFVNAVMYEEKNSFDILYPLLVMVISVPYVIICMNESATIYIFIYEAIPLMGCFVGSKLKRSSEKMVNWINSFELLCYFIVFVLVVDILKSKNYRKPGLLISGILAGFCLELLAVRFADIYHYSNDFFMSVDFYPYRFPFFRGLMWGGISVRVLRITNEFSISNVMKALLSGRLIVSTDLLLDVVTIGLNGGFWVWDGRPITLGINHHMFMNVIWVNFLGYMFEVPAIIFMTLKRWDKSSDKSDFNIGKSLLIGICGISFVAVADGISFVLDRITDEWFSCIAFLLIWIFVFTKLISVLISHHKSITFKNKEDWSLFVFWFSVYVYCIAALFHLNITSANFLCAFFTFFIMIMTLVLNLIDIEDDH